jgi:uncharacterized protein (DUF2237 family)
MLRRGCAVNVLGTMLQPCSFNEKKITGWYRDGYCNTDQYDSGEHWIWVQVSSDFLESSKSKGNDLSTPKPEYGFPGLRPGDKWWLCTSRWLEAYYAGIAPKISLESTHENALKRVSLDTLEKFALDDNELNKF